MKRPELVNATPAQLDELLAQAKTTFSPEQYELLEGVLGTFVYVMQALQNAKTSIKRFRQMLFGARTESKGKVPKTTGGAGEAGEPATLVQRTGVFERPHVGTGRGRPTFPA